MTFDGPLIVYTPSPDFCGTDQFTYTVTDITGVHSDTATVTVNVLCLPAIPAQPIATDDFATTSRGTKVYLSLLENDVIPKGKTR